VDGTKFTKFTPLKNIPKEHAEKLQKDLEQKMKDAGKY
jgi:hypothetical protein